MGMLGHWFLVYLRDDTKIVIRVRAFRGLSVRPNLLCSVMCFHLHQVLVKGIFIEGSFAHIKHLQWLTMLEKGP